MLAHHLAGSGKTGLQARSISRRVWAQLQGETFRAHILAVFDRACTLVTGDGDVIALVLPQVGDGPLNIVVDGTPDAFTLIKSGTPAQLARDCLQVGQVSVSLSNARTWEPCPDWDRLRPSHLAITQRLPRLQTTAIHPAPEGSLLTLLSYPQGAMATGGCSRRDSAGEGRVQSLPEPPWEGPAPALVASARAAAEAIRDGWRGDVTRLQSGAEQLAGLGGGLTPAGDDFLAGLMLWAWTAHPDPRRICHRIVDSAAAQTTTLSAAFLRAAGRGECNASWHRLLAALAEGGEDQLAEATQDVLHHGHTSGADTLAGFLWMEC